MFELSPDTLSQNNELWRYFQGYAVSPAAFKEDEELSQRHRMICSAAGLDITSDALLVTRLETTRQALEALGFLGSRTIEMYAAGFSTDVIEEVCGVETTAAIAHALTPQTNESAEVGISPLPEPSAEGESVNDVATTSYTVNEEREGWG